MIHDPEHVIGEHHSMHVLVEQETSLASLLQISY